MFSFYFEMADLRSASQFVTILTLNKTKECI